MIALTGATGKTGSQVAELLLKRGEEVRAIGRDTNRLRHLTSLGAQPCPGNQLDIEFLTRAFTGVDAAYLLIPPHLQVRDVRSYYNAMGDAAVQAIDRAQVPKVVFLSSLGAEHPSGTGPVVGLHDVEQKLRSLPDVDIAILRPGYFMENLLWSIPTIECQGIISNHTDPNVAVYMIATRDIAARAAELLSSRFFRGHQVIDLYGDRITFLDATTIVGRKIGRPDLVYVHLTGEEARAGLINSGLSEDMARSYVELSKALTRGLIRPTRVDGFHPTSPTRFRDFVDDIFYQAHLKTGHVTVVKS